MKARNYKGRTVRVLLVDYYITDTIFGRRKVSGYAVDAGQIPRFAVRECSSGWWCADDWDTGRSIVTYAEDMNEAIAEALNKYAMHGEAAYRKAVAASKWPSNWRSVA